MQQFQSRLPVPAIPPNSQAAVGGVPHHSPITYPLPQPHLQQLAPLITGFVIYELQNHASQNELRSCLFNLCSANGWQNPTFEMTVMGTADLFDLIMSNPRQPPVEQGIAQAAAKMTQLMTAYITQQYQQDLNPYIKAHQVNDLNALMQEFMGLQQQIQQMRERQMQATQYGGNMMPGNQGFPQARGGHQGTATGIYANPGMPQHNAPPGRYQPPGMMGVRPGGGNMFVHGNQQRPPLADSLGSSITYGMGRRAGANNPATESLDMSPGGPTPRVERTSPHALAAQRSAFSQDPPQPLAARNEPLATPTFVSLSNEKPWPKVADPLRPYDRMQMEDGSEVRPAKLSGWETTLSPKHPYRLAYDASKFILFHVKRPSGEVNEVLFERSEDMGYLDNELNPKLREAAREKAANASGETVVPNWGLADRLRRTGRNAMAVMATEAELAKEAEMQENQEGDADVDSGSPQILEEVMLAHSLSEAEIKVMVSIGKQAAAELKGQPFEFYFDQITPMAATGDFTSVLDNISNRDGYEDIRDLMIEARDILTEDVWKTANERMTAGVNAVLQKNLSLKGWSIDSFVDDIADLIMVLKTKYEGAFLEPFLSSAVMVSGASLSVLTGDAYETYLKNVGVDEDETDRENRFVVFRDRCSVTQVPWTMDSLQLELNDGGMIPREKMPKLFDAVDSIFTRTEDMPVVFARRYIQTSDKKLIDLRQGFLAKDAYLLFPA